MTAPRRTTRGLPCVRLTAIAQREGRVCDFTSYIASARTANGDKVRVDSEGSAQGRNDLDLVTGPELRIRASAR